MFSRANSSYEPTANSSRYAKLENRPFMVLLVDFNCSNAKFMEENSVDKFLKMQ